MQELRNDSVFDCTSLLEEDSESIKAFLKYLYDQRKIVLSIPETYKNNVYMLKISNTKQELMKLSQNNIFKLYSLIKKLNLGIPLPPLTEFDQLLRYI